jgi:hypothetical protein
MARQFENPVPRSGYDWMRRRRRKILVKVKICGKALFCGANSLAPVFLTV